MNPTPLRGSLVALLLGAGYRQAVGPIATKSDGSLGALLKQYSIESRFLYWLFVVVMPCFLVSVGGIWIWIAATQPKQRAPVWFGVVWLGATLFGCYRQMTMPYRIEVTDTGAIHFVGVFRNTTVTFQEIVSVKAFAGNFVEVKHASGKILMLHQFTGFHEFLTDLKHANQNVQIHGC